MDVRALRATNSKAVRYDTRPHIFTLYTIGLLSFLLACSQSGSNLVGGGLYYTQNDNDSYSVIKILKLDDGGVHVRLYSNQFSTPPAKVDESTLYTVGVDREPNETLGIGAPADLQAIL